MKSSVIAVGTELLSGAVVNSNAAYISRGLNELGIDVISHYAVNDDPHMLKKILEAASADCDLIICSGGLGPTEDDLTKETVCEFLNVPLVVHEETEKLVHEFYGRGERAVSPNSEKQKYVPENSSVFRNNGGTAPGFAVEKNGITVICVPGVPREMKLMFQEHVKPYLIGRKKTFIKSARIELFGIGESLVETAILDLIENYSDPVTATYAKESVVEVCITSERDSEEEAEAAVSEIKDIVMERLGDHVFSSCGRTLPETVRDLLTEMEICVSAAEAGTKGLLCAAVSGDPEMDRLFGTGYVLSGRESFERFTGQTQNIEEKFIYSAELADTAAVKLHELTGSRMCTVITGCSETEGGYGMEPGTCFISILFDGRMYRKETGRFIWTPELTREFMVQSALFNMYKILSGREI